MSYYRDRDPRRPIWERLSQLEEQIQALHLILDEIWCEMDDGHHWHIEPIQEEE